MADRPHSTSPALDPIDDARGARLSLLATTTDGRDGVSALGHTDIARLAGRFPDNDTFRIDDLSPLGLLQVRVDPTRDGIGEAVRDATGLELPAVLQSTSNDDRCLRWQGPDRWLLSCAPAERRSLEQSLRERLSGHCAVVDVSDGFCALLIGGQRVLEVLAKSTGHDLRDERFPPGKVVGTHLAKVDVSLRRVAAREFELLVRRSLADYLWLWLQRASREYMMP